MAKRRSVIHVESGKVFATSAEAERAFGFPGSVLSEAIRLGKPYRGHVFKFVDEADSENTEVTERLEPSDVKSVLSMPKVTSDTPTAYGKSPFDKDAACEYFCSLGYDVKLEDGVVMFHDISITNAALLISSSGYGASWGCTSSKTKKFEESVNE